MHSRIGKTYYKNKKGEEIPISKRSKIQKIRSLLDNEDIKLQVASYLHQHKFEFYVTDFIVYITDTIFPSVRNLKLGLYFII